MILELLKVIQEISKETPGGVMVLCASSQLLSTILKVCEQAKVGKMIEKYKSIHAEPSCKSHYSYVTSSYSNDANNKGSILLAVGHGEFVESIDFANTATRVVVFVGLPYPEKTDLKNLMKTKHLETQRKITKKGISTKLWLNNQALRTVRSIIAKVTRQSNDFGHFLMIDERYRGNKILNQNNLIIIINN